MIMSGKSADAAEVIAFRDAAEFEAWLAEHVDQQRRRVAQDRKEGIRHCIADR